MRLFGQLGQAKILVEFATDELFHEMGVWREIEPFLIAIAEEPAGDAETRLWALDGLVFNDLREGNIERGLERIDVMRALLDNNQLGSDEWLAWAMKRMLAMSSNNDVQGVIDMLAEVEKRLPESDQHHRIFRYNRAVAMFKLGVYDLTLQETEQLGEEYYALLGLSPEQVFARNLPAIRPLLPKGRDNTDDLKHLADTLDLHTQALQQSGRSSPLARISLHGGLGQRNRTHLKCDARLAAGSQCRVALHRARKTDAEWTGGELQRPAPGRVLERASAPQLPPCPRTHRGMEDRLQPAPATHQPRWAHAERICNPVPNGPQCEQG